MRSGSVVVLFMQLVFVVSVHAQQGSPAGAVPTSLLAQRRVLLLDRIGDGVVLLRSSRVQDVEGEDFPQSSDFRQDNDFFYLTGIEIPESWLVLIAHSGSPDQVLLYIPPRNAEQEQWTGPQPGLREAAAMSGIRDVRETTAMPSDAAELLKGGTALYVELPHLTRELCSELEGDARNQCVWLFLKPLEPATVEMRDARPQLAALRLIKDADELQRMRRAIEITTAALRSTMQHSKPGDWEYEIEARIEQGFHSAGAERVGFPTIVGSGPNSTVLHYDKSRRRTTAGDLVVMDVGAEYGYYTADVTRTMPISGKFTPRQRAVYNLVLGSQQAAIDSVHPGMTLIRLDEIARQYMERHSGSLCGGRTCDEYFTHAVGHWLGMDVHDPADTFTPFAAGMVLTVEPGVYLADEGLGVRIEDDVLVTQTGHEVLSAGAPRSAEDIEVLMAQTGTVK